MTWLVLAMGVLLVLVGAVSVISGAPIIQIERGWAEVIAGSVAVSGGAVTFALGVVLFRLQALQHLASRGVGPAPAVQTAEAVRPSLEEFYLRPTHAPDDPVHLTPEDTEDAVVATPTPAAEASADHPALWKSVREPALLPPADQGRAVEPVIAASTSVEAADTASAVETVTARQSSAAGPEDEDDDEGAARRLAYAPSPRAPVSEDRARRPSTFSRDWMTRPLLRSRGSKPAPAEPPPLFAGPPTDGEETHSPSIEVPGGDRDVTVPLERRSASSIEDRAEPESEARQPELAVIGRYQAGASTYTMFSNGAIDVETEAGDVHRFGSMAELKAFIARQEDAVT